MASGLTLSPWDDTRRADGFPGSTKSLGCLKRPPAPDVVSVLTMRARTFRAVVPAALAIAGAIAVTMIGRVTALNANAMGFVYLVVVLVASLRGGLLAGTLASIVATLTYNYFFFPPLYTFVIHEAANWVALAAFLITSVVVSRLVVAARIQADRAEQRREALETLSLERERLVEEQAHMHALRESETLKTSLLRAISHDLSTPLTAITIHTQALRRKAEQDDDLQQAVRGIADETGRLHRRIDNLLAMARLEAGKAKPHREPTPPADLFHAVRDNLPLVFQTRPVTVHVEDDCPDADVDPSLALEVLVNLIENAHRVSPGGAPLELVARVHPLDRAQVRIEVRDRGPGLPPGVTDAEGNILPGATSDVAQRGLGLEIARSLAAANGGRIGITPRDGGGSVARFDVVAAPLPAEQPV
jgi:K+-sensing histidine kinase KdpD